jgi:hypothetical protein
VIELQDNVFTDPIALRNGPLDWRPEPDGEVEEVLYFQRETPHRKYGAGALHPGAQLLAPPPEQAVQASDTLGIEPDTNDLQDDAAAAETGEAETGDGDLPDSSDDFEVTSPDIRHPSTVGISFCVRLDADGLVNIRLPRRRRFRWQDGAAAEFPLNGRYERGTRRWTDDLGRTKDAPIWRRSPAVLPDTCIAITRNDLVAGQVIRRDVLMPEGSPITLRIELFPRQIQNEDDVWLLTVVLRNSTQAIQDPHEATLYQAYFEVVPEHGSFAKYPESQRPFAQLDPEEQSLSLLGALVTAAPPAGILSLNSRHE